MFHRYLLIFCLFLELFKLVIHNSVRTKLIACILMPNHILKWIDFEDIYGGLEKSARPELDSIEKKSYNPGLMKHQQGN